MFYYHISNPAIEILFLNIALFPKYHLPLHLFLKYLVPKFEQNIKI